MKEATCSTETLVSACHTTQCDYPENHNMGVYASLLLGLRLHYVAARGRGVAMLEVSYPEVTGLLQPMVRTVLV